MLIVDDEEAILFAMREFFTAQGYDVDCAQDPQEAEALLAHHAYAIVIADLRLTEAHAADGLEVVAEARERSLCTRIIVLTAYGDREIELEARRRGVDAFLLKPQRLPELARLVADLVTSGT